MVVDSSGDQSRFLRGMITHDLVQRGVGFDDAYSVASAVRGHLADREEVGTSEILDLVERELERIIGTEALGELQPRVETSNVLSVLYHGEAQPFSRGLLARSIHAAGLDLDRAYRVITELEGQLHEEDVLQISSEEIVRRVGDLLEKVEGKPTARRYRLVRRIRRLPRPLLIYIGGASGTGKSSLALELAPLLRIFRINATDTIRQVMRIVFTPAILPALHHSSFEVVEDHEPPTEARLGSDGDLEHADRVIRSFEEQATRVCVGVRAVVERAIAEHLSVVVEGVHLHPLITPFADLEGAAFQVPMMLATLDEEVHRTRFLNRSLAGLRGAERYLENFGSIRVIHEHLLGLAEANDLPLLDTSEREVTAGAVQVVTGMLQKSLPALGSPGVDLRPSAPALLLVIDGLADRPVRALGGRTPLAAAETPTFDRLAKEGSSGLADPIAPGVTPDTAAGSLALFGQSPLAMKRGPVEAVGAGLLPRVGDIALRGNFATLDERGQVVNRRAGRIRGAAALELAAALDRLPVPGLTDLEFRVQPATEHRLAILMRGSRLSSAIRGSDPGDGAIGPPLAPEPEDPSDDRAVYTAGALALFEQEARKVLTGHAVNSARVEAGEPPANAVVTRGAGHLHRLITLEEAGIPLRLACVAGDKTILGLAGLLGGRMVSRPGMTANLDTDLELKFDTAMECLRRDDLVILHIKGADIAAHDRRPDLKASFLEDVDAELKRLLNEMDGPLRVAIASDHATLSEGGQHTSDPLPVVIWGTGVESDDVERYDEQAAAAGALQRFPLQMLLGRLFQLS